VNGAQKRIQTRFFRHGKSEPVRDWLENDLTLEDRKKVGTDIMAVEFAWPVGMPLVRPLAGASMRCARACLTERLASCSPWRTGS
jgi:hypothetical protein